MNNTARILLFDACIAASLALGFTSDDASIRFVFDTSGQSFPFDRADEVRVPGGTTETTMTTFDGDRKARVESPCIRHCTLDDDDICLGCFRSIDEICAWAAADNAERQRILAAAMARRQQRAAHGS